jgi:hypothetical protein
MMLYKNWHLICNECHVRVDHHGWDHEIPLTCLCGGLFENLDGTMPKVKQQTTKDASVILQDIERFPEHLGG